MKRFTLILSLLVAMVTTAMAQIEISISPTTGNFTKSNSAKNWHGEWTSTAVDGVQVVLTAGEYANNMTITDGNVEMWTGTTHTSLYTLSVTSGYVITGYSFDFVGKNAADNRFVTISTTSKTDNATTESKTFAVEGLNTRTTEFTFAGYVEGDATDKNNGVIVTNFKVYVAEAAPIPAGVTIANGLVKVSDYPRNGEWAENTNWYLIQNKKGGYVSTAAAYCNANGKLVLSNSADPGDDNENALWCVVGNETDGYKFYNKANGTSKVLLASRAQDSADASFNMADATNADGEYFDVANSSLNGYVVVFDHNNTNGTKNNYWNMRGNNQAYWFATTGQVANDDGSAYAFLDVAEYAEALNQIQNFLTLTGAEYSATQLVTKETASEMMYSNAYCTDTQWGDAFTSWDVLFDNNAGTFFHSEYASGKTSTDGLAHYLRVDMGDGKTIEEFQFTYTTRQIGVGENHPKHLIVEGSNEADGTYTTIQEYTSGLPNGPAIKFTSETLTCNEPYRYIRFRVLETYLNDKDSGGKSMFYIGEFGMTSAVEFNVASEYEEYKEMLLQLYMLKNSASTTTSAKDRIGILANMNTALTLIDEIKYPDYYALLAKIEELAKYVDGKGTTVGSYNTSDAFVTSYESAEATLENKEDAAAHSASLATLNALELPALILPEEGTFYNIVNVLHANGIVYSGNDNRIYWEAGKSGSTAVWQFVNNGDGTYEIISVHTQQNINNLGWAQPSYLGNESDMNFVLTGLGDRMFTIISNPEIAMRTMHAQADGALVYYNDPTKGNASSWYINEVESFSHTLKVGTAEWSTLVLGFNATIPTAEGFKAYTVASVEDGYVKLEEATGVLGANTPIIVNAPAGKYEFVYTANEATVTPATDVLKGTLYDKNIEADAYVLAIKNNNVGLYKAEKNISTNVDNDSTEETTYEAFKNNANKAYLVVPGASEVASYSFRFGEGTTGIDQITDNRVQSTAIYDLTGRRVENISAPGIYIVGGRKVLVK